MEKSKINVIKIKRNKDWSKLVGKLIFTYECLKPQLVCKNGTLERKLLALSGYEDRLVECGCFIAHSADGEYKQFCTSHDPDGIYAMDLDRALEGLHKKIKGKWGKVTIFEFMHTHPKGSLSQHGPLSQIDMEFADKLVEQFYPKGIKKIIVTAVSRSGYSFKYLPPLSAFNSKYRKIKEK